MHSKNTNVYHVLCALGQGVLYAAIAAKEIVKYLA